MKHGKLIAGVVVFAVLVGFGTWAYRHVGFNFAALRAQLVQVRWTKIALGFAFIYAGYVLRSVRWALLIRHNRRVPVFSLLGTQVIGFTSVALVGRVADLARPYMVAKKTGLPISTQVAVYIVERLFDAGSMALMFSSVILLAPAGALPHPEIFRKVGYWGLAGAVAGALFLVAVRVAGGAVASAFERVLGSLSQGLGKAVGNKIREFRTGLDTLRTAGDLLATLGISLAMWGLIMASYLSTMRAFEASPQLAR